MKLWVCLGDW